MVKTAFISANPQDIEEIRFLKHTYAALADACSSSDGAGHGAEMASLFIEDGVWEAPPEHGGRHAGRKAIETFFSGLGQWAARMLQTTTAGTSNRRDACRCRSRRLCRLGQRSRSAVWPPPYQNPYSYDYQTAKRVIN
jgi:hypothetical protein